MNLTLQNISKDYGEFKLRDVSLSIDRGEYFMLLGRSGAGKSQLLEIIAGLQKPDTGKIFMDGKDITSERIQNRKIGLVFQDFALFPHMTSFGNIAYPLKIKGHSRAQVNEMVTEMASLLNVSHLLERKPAVLSIGEQQRVAIARTLVTSPGIILLDEPMASVDTALRDDIRRLLRYINGRGITILHITHDYNEAMRLASRVGIIHNGKILQTGNPAEVFAAPANRFVARFAGIRNFFRLNIKSKGSKVTGETGKIEFRLLQGAPSGNRLAVIDSSRISISTSYENSADNCINATITEIYRTESGYELYADAGDKFHVNFSNEIMKRNSFEEGDSIYLSINSNDIVILNQDEKDDRV